VQRTATLAQGASITVEDFACRRNECLSALLWKGETDAPQQRSKPVIPLPVLPRSATPLASTPSPASAVAPAGVVDSGAPPDDGALANRGQMLERDRLIEAMEKSGWVQAKAARILGLTPRQIGYALKKHNIEVKFL
jgi:Nif-specific regulatory protein